MKSQQRVNLSNMPELIGVRQMFTIPRQKIIALMDRRQGKVESIPEGVFRHHMMLDVDIHGILDIVLYRDRRQAERHRQGIFPVRKAARVEFGKHGCACKNPISVPVFIPPLAGPVAHGDDGWEGAPVVVETEDRRF
jgi:hypothetical protein